MEQDAVPRSQGGESENLSRRPPGGTPALVRLRGREDGTVEVRSPAVKSRGVSNRNCVVATRGGEQRNENDQSVTTSRYTETGELDSVGVDGRAFERMAKPVERAIGEEPNRRTAGWSPDDTPMVGDGMAGSPRDRNQGDPPGSKRCSRLRGPKSRPAGVRASVVATKRVTTVERRERRKVDGR